MPHLFTLCRFADQGYRGWLQHTDVRSAWALQIPYRRNVLIILQEESWEPVARVWQRLGVTYNNAMPSPRWFTDDLPLPRVPQYPISHTAPALNISGGDFMCRFRCTPQITKYTAND